MTNLPYVNLHKHCAGGTDFADPAGWAPCGFQPEYLIRRIMYSQAHGQAAWALTIGTVAACWPHAAEMQYIRKDDSTLLATQAFSLETGQLVSSNLRPLRLPALAS